MLADLLAGAGYLLKGFRLLGRRGVRGFVFWPLLVSALVLAGGLAYCGHLFAQLLATLLPPWASWAGVLLWPLFAVAALAVLYLASLLVASLLAAPFNGWLAAAAERALTGLEPAAANPGWHALPRELAAALREEGRKLAYFIALAIPFLLALLVPAVGPALWFLFSAWTLACNYADYPMGNHGLEFAEQRRLLWTQRALSLGFGSAVLLVTLVPGLNLFAMPAAVAGATAMYLERFAARNGRPPSPGRRGS